MANMTMTDVKIQVPDEMVSYVIANDEQSELMRNAMLLYPYVKNLTISHGKAAEILGICKYGLINLYGELGLPYLDQDMDEIAEEMQYWKKLKGGDCMIVVSDTTPFDFFDEDRAVGISRAVIWRDTDTGCSLYGVDYQSAIFRRSAANTK